MSLARVDVVPARSKGRDKLSNGRLMPRSVDMRSASGRRYRFLLQAYITDLGGDLNEAELGLVRQAVGLQLHAERLQAAIVSGELIDGDMLVRVSSEARRALAALRTKAEKRKPAGPTLAEYVARRAAEKAASAPDGDAA